MYEAVVIGSGPAGLSAALYLKRAGKHVIIIEKEYEGTGQIARSICVDNYRGFSSASGETLGLRMERQCQNTQRKTDGKTMKKVIIKRSDVEKMIAHAREKLPNEACGLIAGREQGDDRRIEKVYYLTNTDASNEHFSLDPKEQLQAVKDMRANGLQPLGNWHSHPESPSRPSEEDKRLAYDAKASYLILSLMEEIPVLHSFRVENGEAEKEILVIQD